MECVDELPNGRPLSLPSSFTSTSPTSPVVQCCSCASLSKSNNSVCHSKYKQWLRDDTQTSAPLKTRHDQLRKLPKFSWPTLKSREKPVPKPRRRIPVESDNSKSLDNFRFSNSKSTTWAFVQTTSTDDDVMKENEFEISPIYQSPYEVKIERQKTMRKAEKQQVFTMTPITDRVSRNVSNGNIGHCNTEPTSLRQLMLTTQLASHVGSSVCMKSEIFRSPGPLDGSPYAQVKKKKRSGKESTQSSLCDNRGYHSADELSCAANPYKESAATSTIKETRSAHEVNQSYTANEGQFQVVKTATDAPPMTSSGLSEVDLLRDVVNGPTVPQFVPPEESGYQTITMTEASATSQTVFTTADVEPQHFHTSAVETSSHDGQVVTSLSVAAPQEIRMTYGSAGSGKRSSTSSSSSNSHKSYLKSTKEWDNDARLSLGNGSSFDHTMNHSPLVSSSISSSLSDMSPSTKNQLTKEQVHEAVALINECLSDQEMRSGSVSSNDIQQTLHERLSSYSTTEFDSPSSDEPQFSPAQPDYSLRDIDQQFADKSPEYALPVRDVVLGTIPARAAVIMTQNSVTPAPADEMLDNAIADLVKESAPHPHGTKQAYSPANNLEKKIHENNINSGGSVGITTPTSISLLSKDTFDGDVDNRIDGSSLNMSVPKEVRSYPKVDGNRVTLTTRESPSSEMSLTHVAEDSVEHEKRTPVSEELYLDKQSELEDEEEEEERKMREEIENTQKRLLWLQEQRNQLKKQKQEKAKRHSFGYSTSSLAPHSQETSNKTNPVSATLPRPLGSSHIVKQSGRTSDQSRKGTRAPTTQERDDMAELLKSVQQMEIPKSGGSNDKETSPSAMTSATMRVASGNQYSHFQNTSPGFHVPEPTVVKRADIFTPAYAHPMHQPQHMGNHHYQIQQQRQEEESRKKEEIKRLQEAEEKRKKEELVRKRKEEERRLFELDQQQIKKENEKRKQDLELQEKRRQAERELQDKFQLEFEQRQKKLQQEKQSLQKQSPSLSSHRQPQTNIKHQTPTTKPAPVACHTLPSPRRTPRPAPSSTVQAKSDELQTQLDELDKYIAQLSQNFDVTDGPIIQPSNKNDQVPRRRSYSINSGSKTDQNVPISPETITSAVGKKVTPPRPPSRTKSSFDSVSRRLSHGFELAQIMRQNSIEQDMKTPSKADDDVFSPQQTPQPSYPPQTRHTRPAQQQISASPALFTAPPSSSVTPSQKSANMEDRLSPQLFLAMTVNPGGRPVEEIHSYKEDLDPAAGKDVTDSAPVPGTPGFPVSPTTPYVNSSSHPASHPHTPAGMAKTPLSALGLKPSQHPQPAINQNTPSQSQGGSQLSSAPKQQANQSNGTNLTSTIKLEEQRKPAYHKREEPNNNVQNNVHDNHTATTKQFLNKHSLDSGYGGDHNARHPSNGWVQNSPVNSETHQTNSPNGTQHQDRQLKSPWVHSGGSSPQASTPSRKSPRPVFAYNSTYGGTSPSASRSLTGSNDSLLSDGSSNHPHLAYQQQRLNGSHPSLPPKESSIRNSGSSIRSTSTGSGYLGGTSQTSPHSTGSSVSSTTGHYPFSSQPVNRRESQLSSYDRQGSHQMHHNFSSDDGALSSPTSGRTSSSSIPDVEKLAGEVAQSSLTGSATPKFIKDTTSYWYKPDITREQALAMLRVRSPGSFVVRDSRCYPGAFGLALKVQQVPQAVLATAKPGTDMNNELVRHFLIEPSTRGVKLKGCANEPVFGSLSALIYQHSITPLALPCKLIIPTENQEIPTQVGPGRTSSEISNSASELLRQGAACNVLYLGSAETESLTGPEAIERGMRECTQNQNKKTSVVHFKVSPQGITLTDNARKIFFRRHYPTATVTFCGMDPRAREPHNRRWDASNDRGPPNARVFGFVAKKPGSAVDNMCHLFAELDLDQPAPAIVNFVSKVLIGTN